MKHDKQHSKRKQQLAMRENRLRKARAKKKPDPWGEWDNEHIPKKGVRQLAPVEKA